MKAWVMPDPNRFGLAQLARGYTHPGPIALPDRAKAPSIHSISDKRSSRKLGFR